MTGVRKLSAVLTGTLCPKIKLNIPKEASEKHNNIKKEALQRLKQHLSSEGVRIVAVAGVSTNEASVRGIIGRATYNGRLDVLAIAKSKDGYIPLVVEVKSGRASSRSLDALFQASIYAAPFYKCLSNHNNCEINISGKEFIMKVYLNSSSVSDELRAEFDVNIDDFNIKLNNIRSFRVFLAGPGTLEDLTPYAKMIIEGILSAPSVATSSAKDMIVPGPWCAYCRLLHEGACTAGLL